MVILEATNIKKYYGDFCALAGVDIHIREGEFISVIGPNGAGKTTLINCLTGFLKPDTGQVRFKGKDIAGMGPEKLSKMGIARSFQLVHIFPDLSLIDTLKVAIISRQGKGGRFFASLSKDKVLHQQALEVAELFVLSDRLEEASKNFPTGKWCMFFCKPFKAHGSSTTGISGCLTLRFKRPVGRDVQKLPPGNQKTA